MLLSRAVTALIVSEQYEGNFTKPKLVQQKFKRRNVKYVSHCRDAERREWEDGVNRLPVVPVCNTFKAGAIGAPGRNKLSNCNFLYLYIRESLK